MNRDFRMASNFASNEKFLKLLKRLGDHGALSWIRLLAYVSQHRPKGQLGQMDVEGIALAAGYADDGDRFVQTLVDLKLLDRLDDGGLRIHDWENWNPWAAGAGERIKAAQDNASKKWQTANQVHRTRSERLSAARVLGTHTKAQFEEMASFFDGRCVRCGSGSGDLVQDHVRPIYQGGSDGPGAE